MKTYKKEMLYCSGMGIRIEPHRVVRMDEHLHEFVEAVYIMDGSGVHTVNGVEYRVKRGALLFINYHQTHSFSSEDSMEIWDVCFDPEWLSERLIDPDNAFELLTLSGFAEFETIDTRTSLVQFHGAERSRIEQLLRQMYDEVKNAEAGAETVLKAQANILLTLIFRKMAGEASPMAMTPDFLRYLRTHCTEKITLEELAKNCCYNPSYFSRLFREHYGMTLTEFLLQSRMELAEQLLRETNLSVEEIAARTGFSGSNSFYRSFKERYGASPREYRKKLQ